jgi:hypothetical protein
MRPPVATTPVWSRGVMKGRAAFPAVGRRVEGEVGRDGASVGRALGAADRVKPARERDAADRAAGARQRRDRAPAVGAGS